MLGLLALNPLNTTDIVFFIVLAAIVALCIGVYFLIPVFNKKQYKELRDNLKKREAAFKSNVRRTDGLPTQSDVSSAEQAPSARMSSDDIAVDPAENEEK